MKKRYVAACISIALVGLSFGMAYLIRPHAPNLQLVTEQQELPDLKAHYSTQSGLVQRVSKSYGLALVLVISEYSRNNAVALESIRSWAHQNFQHSPGFLHIVPAETATARHNSVIDSLVYSLMTPPRFLFESQALSLLQRQITLFHHTKAYEAFRADYYELFGLDHESAGMLARYQSERGREAVDIVLSAFYWMAAAAIGLALHFRSHPAIRSTRWQRLLAFFWFSLSLFYIIVSWTQNDVSVLVSSIACVLLGLYLRRPIAISFGEDKGLNFRLLVPNRAVLAGATWITVSLVAIQFLTWIHTGTMSNSDPITLMVSSITGDFIHDHANAKKHISRMIGAIWLVSCVWALWRATNQTRATENIEANLKPISEPVLQYR